MLSVTLRQHLTPRNRIRTLNVMKNSLAVTVLASCIALCACGPDSSATNDPEAANAKPEGSAKISDSSASKIGVTSSNDAVTNAQEAANKKKKQ